MDNGQPTKNQSKKFMFGKQQMMKKRVFSEDDSGGGKASKLQRKSQTTKSIIEQSLSSFLPRIVYYVSEVRSVVCLSEVCRSWYNSIRQLGRTGAQGENFWREMYCRYYFIYPSSWRPVSISRIAKDQEQSFIDQFLNLFDGYDLSELRNLFLDSCDWREAFIVRFNITRDSLEDRNRNLACYIANLCQSDENGDRQVVAIDQQREERCDETAADVLLENWDVIREKFRELDQQEQYSSLIVQSYRVNDLCLFFDSRSIVVTYASHMLKGSNGTGENRYEYQVFSKFVPSVFEVVVLESMEDFVVEFEMLVNNSRVAFQTKEENNHQLTINITSLGSLFSEWLIGSPSFSLTRSKDNIVPLTCLIYEMLKCLECLFFPIETLFDCNNIFIKEESALSNP